MSSVVLDASAILAILQQEPGAENLPAELLAESVASTVNLAEVQTKLTKKGFSAEEAWALACSPVPEIVAFDEDLAKDTGALIRITERFGLSLGNRACLALARALHAPVYTTERIWKNVQVGVVIHVIR
jgi:PIN domain nuclease of toxin-antitoxin system